jgi:hypothetical protein
MNLCKKIVLDKVHAKCPTAKKQSWEFGDFQLGTYLIDREMLWRFEKPHCQCSVELIEVSDES